MAIVSMKRFTLLAFDERKTDILKGLQKFESVHFRNPENSLIMKNGGSSSDLSGLQNSFGISGSLDFLTNNASPERLNSLEDDYAKVKFSLNKLEPYMEKPKLLKSLTTPRKELNYADFDGYLNNYDFKGVYEAVKFKDMQLNGIKTDISKFRLENESLRPWIQMDVSPVQLESLKSVRSIIGAVTSSAADSFRIDAESHFPEVYVESIGSIKDDRIILIILPAEQYADVSEYLKNTEFSKLSLNFKGVPAEIIAANSAKIEELQALSDENVEVIKGQLCSEYDNLCIASDCFKTLLARERLDFLKTDSVTVFEGWTPADEYGEFVNIVESICGNDYYIEAEDVEKDSRDVPIKLKNNEVVSTFESITSMFSMPRYNEPDPTPILTPFYMLFFGMMIGDAGYGLVMLFGTLTALNFFTLKEKTEKFIQFFFYLSIAVLFGGLLYGSFFGVTVLTPIKYTALDGTITYKPILDLQSDIKFMLILSIAIGVFQVLFGIGVKGYTLLRNRKILSAIFDSLFWIIALISGIGLLVAGFLALPQFVSSLCGWAFALSLIALAATQGRESHSLAGKIGTGIYAVYGLSGYVGDLVSYTRIIALALSGSYIAYSFNLISGLVPNGPFMIIKIIFGGLIVLIGHALNLGLGALGAYVHSCRLQYIEFFGKFYQGGGVVFSPLCLQNDFVDVKIKN